MDGSGVRTGVTWCLCFSSPLLFVPGFLPPTLTFAGDTPALAPYSASLYGNLRKRGKEGIEEGSLLFSKSAVMPGRSVEGGSVGAP